jgi:asparagine synthase (glutamine-hydrolysing)
LKKLALQYLPSEIVHRRKSGFGVPISEWFRNDRFLGRYLDLLMEPKFRNLGYFNFDSVEKMVKEHRTRKKDYGNALWALTNFAVWHSLFIEHVPPAQV